jgi:hypothetical protein
MLDELLELFEGVIGGKMDFNPLLLFVVELEVVNRGL